MLRKNKPRFLLVWSEAGRKVYLGWMEGLCWGVGEVGSPYLHALFT